MTVHENVILKYSVITGKVLNKGVLAIGEYLHSVGCDKLTDGGFWVWDVKSNVEYFSPKFRESLGYTDDQDFPSAAKSWQDIVDPVSLEKVIASYERCLADNTAPYYQEVKYQTKQGDVLTVLCSGTIINDQKGNPRIMIGTHKLC